MVETSTKEDPAAEHVEPVVELTKVVPTAAAPSGPTPSKLAHCLALIVSGVVALFVGCVLSDGRSVIVLKPASELPRITDKQFKKYGLDYRADELLGPTYGIGLHHDSSGYTWTEAGAEASLQTYIDELGLHQVIAAVPSVVATDGLKHPVEFLSCEELQKAGLSAMGLGFVAEVVACLMIIVHAAALAGLLKPLGNTIAKVLCLLIWFTLTAGFMIVIGLALGIMDNEWTCDNPFVPKIVLSDHFDFSYGIGFAYAGFISSLLIFAVMLFFTSTGEEVSNVAGAGGKSLGVVTIGLIVCAAISLAVSGGEDAFADTEVDMNINMCEGQKPYHAGPGDNYFSNVECKKNGIVQVLEQAGANVTKGYKGGLDAGTWRKPITKMYKDTDLCPVNVHWHLGAEHLSVGQFDKNGKGPINPQSDSHKSDSHAGDSHAADSHAGDSHAGDSHSAPPVNPCKGGVPEDEKPPIWTALADLPCESESAKVQSAADVTVGSAGEMAAGLQPIAEAYTGLDMCAVNVHWHLGAEHRNTGTYDLNGKDWFAANMPDAGTGLTDGQYRLRQLSGRVLAEDIEPGNFCPGYDKDDAAYTTEYEWEYCEGMHVGLTYEIHWPHSNLGACGTEWQYQTHFMDGVLCKANEAGMAPADAAAAVFTGADNYKERVAKLGVQGQVFTIVNDDAYDYPEWDMLAGWNTDLAQDIAIYQGSTTGQKNGDETCRGTGGMVTWQVDRGCHKISAKSFDKLCKVMREQKDDMTGDVVPHNARVTTADFITTDVEMAEGVTAQDLGHRSLAAKQERLGFRCHHYDETDPKFTTPYEWQYCDKSMKVGETYEVHWPHSAAGACGTQWQYQTPFYDGVFCNDGIINILTPLNTFKKIGVQAQIFTIVNDESYFTPDLFSGMHVDPYTGHGQDIAMYTGSTTGTTRDNEICSRYAPVTWQVDRKCHLVSASSFDAMCKKMRDQADDMSADTHAHGAREVSAHHLTANNQQSRK